MHPSYFGILWAALAGVMALLWRWLPDDRRRVRAMGVFLALAGAAWWAEKTEWGGAWLYEVARAFLEIAGIQAGVLLIFVALLRGLRLPRFLGDMVAVAGYAAVLLNLLSRLGVNVTGLIATSAVATAVIGLSLQELLGNLASGIALGLEKEIQDGTWITTDAGTGYVDHVRLRHTAIVTIEGDRILIPNSALTKAPVKVLSTCKRHTLRFYLNYRRNPSQVIEAVERALRESPIAGMSAEPKPRCLILALEKENVAYQVHVWLTEPGRELPAYSAVLMRIYFALARIGEPMRPIPQVLEWQRGVRGGESPDLVDALRRVPLFRGLHGDELGMLAPRLKPLSFGPGEVIIRQGDEGASMFLLTEGAANVMLANEEGLSQVVRVLREGDFFGEMSLLTGEKRSATVVAAGKVDCLRLDKADLNELLSGRTEMAGDISLAVAERQLELAGIREKLDQESSAKRLESTREHLLEKMRRFFSLPD